MEALDYNGDPIAVGDVVIYSANMHFHFSRVSAIYGKIVYFNMKGKPYNYNRHCSNVVKYPENDETLLYMISITSDHSSLDNPMYCDAVGQKLSMGDIVLSFDLNLFYCVTELGPKVSRVMYSAIEYDTYNIKIQYGTLANFRLLKVNS